MRGRILPDLLDSKRQMHTNITKNKYPFLLKGRTGQLDRPLLRSSYLFGFQGVFFQVTLGAKSASEKRSFGVSESELVASGRTIFSAIKKIAREGGLVAPDANTRQCIDCYERIVRQILPRLVLENSPQKSRQFKKKIFQCIPPLLGLCSTIQ